MMVISITAVALLTGYVTTIAGSATHRNLAELDVLLRNVAESATYQIQSSTAPAPLYTPCASVSGTVSNGTNGQTGQLQYGGTALDLSSVNLPVGYSVSLQAVTNDIMFWDLVNSSWNATCTQSTSNPDPAQEILVTAYGPHRTYDSVQFVVMNLNAPSGG